MGYIRGIIFSKGLKEKSRVKAEDFTRTRKVGFVTLICIILNMVRKSTQLELDDFLKKFNIENIEYESYTKQSFSETRQKLSAKAFIILGDGFISKFYEDNDFKTYKEYRLLAVDGSAIEVPNSVETQEHFGYVKNQTKGWKLARAMSSTLYDLENKIVLSSMLERYDIGEREIAIKNINKMVGNKPENIKDLILFDRGYPSIAFIEYLNTQGIKFLMRTSSTFYKEEVQNTITDDELVEIEITKERAGQLRRNSTQIAVGTRIKLRVIKVELDDGEIEVLITNLSKEELSREEAKELYFRRWGIETKFDELKNKFQIENFSGEKPEIIKQDYYATILLCNIASLFEMEAEEVLKKQNAKKTLKYEYRINKNILVGKLKNSLIEVLLEENENKKALMYERLIFEIKRNVVPIIKERSKPRDKKQSANKYPKNQRMAL